MQGDLERVLFDERTILRRLDEIAAQISNDYRDRDLTVIAVLNGSLVFMADLMRRIQLPLRLDCLSVASYHGKAETSGEVIFKQVAPPDVKDRHVLILDDILDSGHTLAAIREKLETAHPRSIRVCVLLSKTKQRARSQCRLSRLRDRGRIRGRLRTRLRRAVSQFALHWSFAKRIDEVVQMKSAREYFPLLWKGEGRVRVQCFMKVPANPSPKSSPLTKGRGGDQLDSLGCDES